MCCSEPEGRSFEHTYVQLVSYSPLTVSRPDSMAITAGMKTLPFVVDCLDDKAQGGAHRADIFTHDPLHNRGFPRIVKAACLRYIEC